MIISVNRIYSGPIWGTLINFDKKFQILIDCGWLISSDTSPADKYLQYLQNIDLILISHPTLEYIGALPYIYCRSKNGYIQKGENGLPTQESTYTKSSWAIPIVCTDPVFRLGRIVTHDSFENYKLSLPFDHFKASDIDEVFNKCVRLRYKQSFVFNFGKEKLIAKPYPSGNTFGGAIWALNYSGRDIVYAVGHSISPQWPIQGASFNEIDKPSLFITDINETNYNEQNHIPMLRNLLRTISKTLKNGGSVLIPVDADGLFLELLIHLEIHWRHNISTMILFPIILLSPIADSIILSVKTMIEWMNKSIQEQFIKHRFNPLDNLNYINIIHSEEELKPFEDLPKVIFSTPGNFDYGFSKELFKEFVVKKQNLIVYTKAPAPTTLTDQIWKHYLAKEFIESKTQEPLFEFYNTFKIFQEIDAETQENYSTSNLEEYNENDYIPESVLKSQPLDEFNESSLAESFNTFSNPKIDDFEEKSSLENVRTKRRKVSNRKLYINSFPKSLEPFEDQGSNLEFNHPQNPYSFQYGEPVQVAKFFTQGDSLEGEKNIIKNTGLILNGNQYRDDKLPFEREYNDIAHFQSNDIDITLGSSKKQKRKLLRNDNRLLNRFSPDFESLTLSDYENIDYQRLPNSVEANQSLLDESDDSTDDSIYDDLTVQDQSISSCSVTNFGTYVYQEEKIMLNISCKMLMLENLQGLTSQSMLRLIISRMSPRRVCLLPNTAALSYHLLSSHLRSSNLAESSIYTFDDQDNGTMLINHPHQNQFQFKSQIEINIPSTELVLQLNDDLWKEFIWSLNSGPNSPSKFSNHSTNRQSPFYSVLFANVSSHPNFQISPEPLGETSYFSRRFNDRFWTSTIQNANLVVDSNSSNINQESPEEKKPTYPPENIPKFKNLSDLPNSTLSETLLIGNSAMKNMAHYLIKLLPNKVSYAPQGGILTISDELAICRKSKKGNIIWEIEGTLDPSYYFARKLLSSQFRNMSRQL